MERVSPPQVNYDNVLPLAIESRSNRREFLPVNGQSFSNANGATIVRIDVNADSMLDATHSYIECDITNNAAATNFLALNPFTPAWIQRLRIESGGVVIEDINEYARLYALMTLNQCPEDYVKNNMSNMGLYDTAGSSALQATGGTPGFNIAAPAGVGGTGGFGVNTESELHYPMSLQGQIKGTSRTTTTGVPADGATNAPTAAGLLAHSSKLASGNSKKLCFPLLSGFLNMDKYIPLIMMNAGFTIELTLCDANRIGTTQVETAADQGAYSASAWSISGCKYVAHLIDLDRGFYDRLRAVMESSAGVLQLAGQTYRHYVGDMPAGAGPHTITLPARVKSVKSIFGSFIDSGQMGSANNFDTSVFQSAFLDSYRFEIGSVRYPQTDVDANSEENFVELQKAFGKLGDFSHQQAYAAKHTLNDNTARDGSDVVKALLSAYTIGYDFEAFQRVALESGINTADRSLPINFIAQRTQATGGNATRCDFYVLTDAIYYINLDGTVSVSV
tara:strand:+ start:11432 stop:12946 length:1515 start_codon:yes stop_codon:yes gene_type:complete